MKTINVRDIKHVQTYYAENNHHPAILDELIQTMDPNRSYYREEFCTILGPTAIRLLASYFDLAIAMAMAQREKQ